MVCILKFALTRAVSELRKIANISENGVVEGTRTTFGKEVQILEKVSYNFDAKTSQLVIKE